MPVITAIFRADTSRQSEMQSQKLKELNSTPIRQLMWRYFWPSFIGVMANSLYNIVDRIFIGQAVGAEALSGVTAVFPIMIIMTAFGMLIGIGASVQVSLSLGRKDLETAQKILGNATTLIILVSIVITIAGFLVKGPMLRLFGANDTTIGYANDYLNYILLGSVMHHFGFSMNGIIRAEGNARIAMYSMLISAGINVPLDALFVLYLGMGVKGAAIATVISMSLLAVWVLAHFLGKRCVVPLRRKYIGMQPEIILAIVSIGISPFLMQAANSVVQALLNLNLIKYGGDLAVGAMGIVNSVVFLIITSIIALNMACQPIIGYNYGACNFVRVKETLRLAIIIATLISTICWVITNLIPAVIIRAFVAHNGALISLGVQGLRLFLLTLPVVGFQIVMGNYFQSIGKASTAVFLTLLRQVFILIPLLLILPPLMGLSGVWLAAPISDTGSAIVCCTLLLMEWKRISRAPAGTLCRESS